MTLALVCWITTSMIMTLKKFHSRNKFYHWSTYKIFFFERKRQKGEIQSPRPLLVVVLRCSWLKSPIKRARTIAVKTFATSHGVPKIVRPIFHAPRSLQGSARFGQGIITSHVLALDSRETICPKITPSVSLRLIRIFTYKDF